MTHYRIIFQWLLIVAGVVATGSTVRAVNQPPSFTLPPGKPAQAGDLWRGVPAGERLWVGIASSADGSRLAAVANGDYLYTSPDFGATWVPRLSGTMRPWTCVACSTDGVQLAAAVDGDAIYTSTDAGATWATHSLSGVHHWKSIASSANGSKLAAVESPGLVWMSLNAGSTWSATSLPSGAWQSVAASADGTKWIAAADGGYLYTSADSGATWSARVADGNRPWVGVTSSADGTRLAAVTGYSVIEDSKIYLSSDSGATWNTWTRGSITWNAIVSSADGMRLFASSLAYGIYSSGDGGVSWVLRNIDTPYTVGALVTSSDGTQVIGATDYLYMSVSHPEVAKASDGSPFTSSNFATNISPGPPSEASQTVTFNVSNDFNQLFDVQPAIDSNGTLSFVPAPNITGDAWVTVQAQDNGDAAIGGVSYSQPQYFKIHVTPKTGPQDIQLNNVNISDTSPAGTVVGTLNATNSNPAASHVFSFVSGFENGHTQNYANGLFNLAGNVLTLNTTLSSTWYWGNYQLYIRVRATDGNGLYVNKVIPILIAMANIAPNFTISSPVVAINDPPGSVSMSNFVSLYSSSSENLLPEQTVTFVVTNDHNEFFSAQPAIDSQGTLTFTPSLHIPSPVTVTVIAKDNGGTLHGGVDTSAPQTFILRGNYAPTDISLSGGSVAENNVSNVLVGTFSSVDADVGDTAQYDLVSGVGSDDNASFSIDGNQLTFFGGKVDFETRTSYTIRVKVTDFGGASFEKAITIHVIDTNDAPTFTLQTPSVGTLAGDYWSVKFEDRMPRWNSVAVSADGMRIAGAANNNHLFLSTDGGSSWQERVTDANRFWTAIALSSDGRVIAAATYQGFVYISTDSGTTWTAHMTDSARSWQGITVSADGNSIAAMNSNDGLVYTSNDAGTTWIPRNAGMGTGVGDIASSADGSKLIVAKTSLYTSADSGTTWTERIPASYHSWKNVASSADGSRLFAVGLDSRTVVSHLYRSTDAGVTWNIVPDDFTKRFLSWDRVACSSDGLRVVGTRGDGKLYASEDGGVTWAVKSKDVVLPYANDLAMAADGSRLVLAANQLYISGPTLAITVPISSGSYAQPGIVKNISPGPPSDAGQTVSFTVTNDNPSMFAVQPAISASGTLTFTPAPWVAGTAVVTVIAKDNGGTVNGGVDTSEPQNFFIKIVGATLSLEVPSGTSLADGATVDFGNRGVGGRFASRIFYIRNTGTEPITGLALTRDGPNTEDFLVGPLVVTNLPVGGSTNFLVYFAPVANGPRTAAIHLASSVPGPANPLDVTLTGTGLNAAVADWRDTHFGTATAKITESEDFNGDGVSNLLEFAFGTSPESKNAAGRKPLEYVGLLTGGGAMVHAGQPILVFDGTTPCGLFVRRKDFVAAGLTYAAQFSFDMATWVTGTAEPMVLADDGTLQVVCTPYPVLPNGKQARYFRVDVNLAP